MQMKLRACIEPMDSMQTRFGALVVPKGSTKAYEEQLITSLKFIRPLVCNSTATYSHAQYCAEAPCRLPTFTSTKSQHFSTQLIPWSVQIFEDS